MAFHSSSQKCCLCIILNSKVEPVFVYEHKVQARLLQTNVKKMLTDMYYTEGMLSGNLRLTRSFRALRSKTKPEYMGHLQIIVCIKANVNAFLIYILKLN